MRFLKQSALCVVVLWVLFAAFAPRAKAYTGVPSYFAEEIENADTRWGIIPEPLRAQDLSMQITRGEFCRVVLLAYQKLTGKAAPETEDICFSDTAAGYVNSACLLGIVSGYPDGTFRQDRLITRQEMFKMIYHFMLLNDDGAEIRRAEADEILSGFADSGDLGDWSVRPTAAVIRLGIVKGTDSRLLDPYSYTTSAQAITLVCRTLNSISGASGGHDGGRGRSRGRSDRDGYGGASAEGASDTPLSDLGFNDQKYILVFGSLDHPVYQNPTEAAADMVSVQVNVWRLGADGSKTTAAVSLTVNQAIAEMIEAIFKEIYEGEEKFPIKSIGGYAWRGDNTSQHSLGLAIDINPDENYMIKSDGTIVCGAFWDPAASPFSIPEDGDVVRAFRRYGFAWGGNAWRSSKDYMHFSYFGT